MNDKVKVFESALQNIPLANEELLPVILKAFEVVKNEGLYNEDI